MKEIFVLGAGASTALADLPLGNELIWNYHWNCARPNVRNNGVYDMTQDNKKFAPLREFLILASRIYPELKPKVKEFDNRNINIFTPIVNEKKYFADEVLKVLQENGNQEGILLIKKLIFQHLCGKSLSQRNAYKEFIEKILLDKKPQNLSIISFNFDYLLTDYCGNGIDNGVSFDYLLPFDCILKNSYLRQKPVSLIKLHGSLDWGLCNKCNKLRLYFPHMVDKHYFEEGSSCNNCGGIIEPYIFIPHQQFDERINFLWDQAKDVLQQAQKVTIIGYSFPEYDQKVIDLFNNALDKNVELEVVDHCERNQDRTHELYRIKRKYRHLLPNLKSDIRISLDGFKDYMGNHS